MLLTVSHLVRLAADVHEGEFILYIRMVALVRYISLLLLLLFASSCAACSYNTDFVVVNASEQPFVVQYQVKVSPGPLSL